MLGQQQSDLGIFFFLTLATAAATLSSSVAMDSIIIRGVGRDCRVGVKKRV